MASGSRARAVARLGVFAVGSWLVVARASLRSFAAFWR